MIDSINQQRVWFCDSCCKHVQMKNANYGRKPPVRIIWLSCNPVNKTCNTIIKSLLLGSFFVSGSWKKMQNNFFLCNIKWRCFRYDQNIEHRMENLNASLNLEAIVEWSDDFINIQYQFLNLKQHQTFFIQWCRSKFEL